MLAYRGARFAELDMSAVLQDTDNGFRLMSETDLDAVMVIEEQVYEYPWARGIFVDCLRMAYSCWVYERDQLVVAYGITSTAAGESHLLNLSVSPDVQRNGLGQAMLEHLITNTKRQNSDILLLEVRPSNYGAVALYDCNGFNEVGVRRNYYPARNGREDALILALSLR